MKDISTNFQSVKDMVRAMVKSRGWIESHSPKNLAMSISIEAAELMEIFQWLTVDDSWNIKKSEEFVHLKEELADVLIYSLSLANQLDIDIAAAIEDKMDKNLKRFPEKL